MFDTRTHQTTNSSAALAESVKSSHSGDGCAAPAEHRCVMDEPGIAADCASLARECRKRGIDLDETRDFVYSYAALIADFCGYPIDERLENDVAALVQNA